MPNLEFSSHMKNVMDAVGEEKDTVIITNYYDSGNEDSRGETIWDDETVRVDRAIVQLNTPTLNNDRQGAEELYDAEVFVPLDTEVFENSSEHSASEVNARGSDYVVEQKDTQNGMIKLGCRRKR